MSDVVVSLPDSLSAAEWRCVSEFQRRVAELRSARALGDPPPAFRMEMKQASGLNVTVSGLPDEDAWRSLLMTFRFFNSKKEPAHFPRIVNILSKHCRHEELQRYMDFLRTRWRDALFSGAMFLRMKPGLVDAEKVLDLWINADYFHSDACKQAALDDLKEAVTPELAKYMLVNAVRERSRYVLMLGTTLERVAPKTSGT
jgi:hypothetical protein